MRGTSAGWRLVIGIGIANHRNYPEISSIREISFSSPEGEFIRFADERLSSGLSTTNTLSTIFPFDCYEVLDELIEDAIVADPELKNQIRQGGTVTIGLGTVKPPRPRFLKYLDES